MLFSDNTNLFSGNSTLHSGKISPSARRARRACRRRYTRIEALTPEILRTFISRIVVHEREVRYCHTSPQQIDIWFRYVGDGSGISEAEADTEPVPLKATGE